MRRIEVLIISSGEELVSLVDALKDQGHELDYRDVLKGMEFNKPAVIELEFEEVSEDG